MKENGNEASFEKRMDENPPELKKYMRSLIDVKHYNASRVIKKKKKGSPTKVQKLQRWRRCLKSISSVRGKLRVEGRR